jgi:hypothetical protein
MLLLTCSRRNRNNEPEPANIEMLYTIAHVAQCVTQRLFPTEKLSPLMQLPGMTEKAVKNLRKRSTLVDFYAGIKVCVCARPRMHAIRVRVGELVLASPHTAFGEGGSSAPHQGVSRSY